MSGESVNNRLKHVSLRAAEQRGGFKLDLDLHIQLDGITAVFGKSGAGKTTLLRLIAGLDRLPGAHVQYANQLWQSADNRVWLPAHKRQIGYIFQSPVLFEHLSVKANLDYAFNRAAAKSESLRLEALVDLAQLDVENLLNRRVSKLSGGERQRVAIARALASNPHMLLMDEPVSALDSKSKQQVLGLIQGLHTSTQIPIVYVSHNLDEIAQLSDHMLLLRDGQLVAEGPTIGMLTHKEVTADSDVLESIVETQVVELDAAYGLCKLRFAGGELWVTNSSLRLGDKRRARIMARDLSLTLERQIDTSIQNVLPAQIKDVRVPSRPDAGDAQMVVELDVGGCSLLALLTRRSVDQLALRPGRQVYAQIKSVALLS